MDREDTLQIGRFYTMGEMERVTGVPAATIRAWERRYGVPAPGRSSGRHRLYSEEDLSMVRWLLARQKEGMSISRAIAAWRYEARRGAPGAPMEAAPVRAQSLADLREAWLKACLRYDRPLAETVLGQAFALYPVVEVGTELLLGGLSRIGEAWFEGEVSVHQEHFASAMASHQVERLIGLTAPWRRERVLLACPPGDFHAFGLLFLSLLLRHRGLSTVFLGANVPVERLDAAVAESRPDLAVLSAQRVPEAAALITMAEVLEELGVPVGYGGGVFNGEPGLQERVPGRYLGTSIPGSVEAIEGLLADLPLSPRPAPIGTREARALECYQTHIPRIESEVRLAVGASTPPRTLAEANRTMAAHLVAAAQIGDFSVLRDGRPWLEAAFQADAGRLRSLRSYLAVYALAAQVHLAECGGEILEWLLSVRGPEPE